MFQMFSKGSAKPPARPSAIQAMWDAEEKLTLNQRRERYKCGKKFTKAEDIIRWESYTPEFPSVYDTKTPVSNTKISEIWFHKQFGLSGPNIYDKFKENPVINSKVALWNGNITTLELDGILNAANNSMTGGGGVDGSIHSAAGRQLYEECRLHNGCDTGKAKITRGYRLPAKYVVATVGPVGEKPQLLYDAYYNSLEVAKNHGIRTFALCGVSTGVYGYPLYAASHIALATVRKWLEKNHKHVDLIVICTFLQKEETCYDSLMPLYFPRSAVIPRRPIPPRPEGEVIEDEEEEVAENAEETTEEKKDQDGEKKDATEENKPVESAGGEGSSKEDNLVAAGEKTAEGTTTTTTTTTETANVEETKDVNATESSPSKGKETESEEKKEEDNNEKKEVSDLADALSNTKI